MEIVHQSVLVRKKPSNVGPARRCGLEYKLLEICLYSTSSKYKAMMHIPSPIANLTKLTLVPWTHLCLIVYSRQVSFQHVASHPLSNTPPIVWLSNFQDFQPRGTYAVHFISSKTGERKQLLWQMKIWLISSKHQDSVNKGVEFCSLIQKNQRKSRLTSYCRTAVHSIIKGRNPTWFYIIQELFYATKKVGWLDGWMNMMQSW